MTRSDPALSRAVTYLATTRTSEAAMTDFDDQPYTAIYNGRCDHCRTLHKLTVEGVGEPTAQTTTMPCCACHRGRVEVVYRPLLSESAAS